jgi:ElaB/YqjD/DUF883 family membrane-anchored ribosome-binding protein
MGANASTEQLMKDLQAAMKDLEALFGTSADAASEQVDQIRERASESLSQAQHEIKRRANKAGRAADAYVHDNPWTIIAAAAGLAFIAGVLVGRR